MMYCLYGKNVLAITDYENHLVGIVTADDILEQMIDENEEDNEKLISVGDYDENSKPLIRSKQRLPWLLIRVVLNLIIAFVLDIFEATLDQVIVLILFQPMILGMAGNIGTQAIAVTILKLNNSDLDIKQRLENMFSKSSQLGF